MQKILVFICALSLTFTQAQTLSKKEARQILEKAWDCLKTSDTSSFVNLWQPQSFASVLEQTYVRQQALDNFSFLNQFLDTALSRNPKISDVEIEEHNLKDTDTKYWIKAWFKYTENDYTGFGFYIAYKNGKWIVRDKPSTSIMQRDY